MLGHQGVLVDEDRILGLDASDAGAGPGHVDRAHARDALAHLLPGRNERLAVLGEAPPPRRHGRPDDVPVEGGAELGQRRGRRGGHRNIAREAADRIAQEQRIDA